VLTDPAATARVPATTAPRVLEKNVLTAMVFPVMVSHVRSVGNVLRQVVGIVPLTVTAHHVPIVLTVQDMQIVVNEESVQPTVIDLSVENVLRMVIVRSEATDLHMVTAQTGANAPVTVIVMLHLAVIVHVMEIVTLLPEASVPHTATAMARLVVIVPTVRQGIAPHMATVVTEMPVQSAEVLVEVAPAEHLVVNVLVEIVAASPLLGTEMHAQSVQSVQSVLPMEIVRSAENAHRMATAVRDQIVAATVPPMEIVLNVVTVPPMAIVMEPLVVSAQVMVIVDLGQTVGETALHTETAAPVRNVQIAHSAVIAPPMVTVAHVQIVVGNVLLMVNVQNALALVTVEVDQTVPVLLALADEMSDLAGKSQNSPKNSAWHANFVWFALTMMIRGSMMMSPVTSSTRLHATN